MGFRDAWKRAGEAEDDFEPDEGTYPVRIVDASAFSSRDGREFMKLRLEVTAGEHRGRQFDDFHGLSNEIGFRIARENLRLYGFDPAEDPEDIEDLSNALLELIGVTAEVTVKHNGGFVNVSVARSKNPKKSDLPGQESFDTSQPVPAGASDDDDIPF